MISTSEITGSAFSTTTESVDVAFLVCVSYGRGTRDVITDIYICVDNIRVSGRNDCTIVRHSWMASDYHH